MRPTLGRELVQVLVRVFYKGEKAQIMNEGNSLAASVILRSDLMALKLPHPRLENVSYVLPGCVQFYWITDRDSVRGSLHFGLVLGCLESRPKQVLHQHVKRKIATKDAQMLHKLSMCDSRTLPFFIDRTFFLERS